jgi:chloramphenicol 3-O-phosphotransferase
MRYYIPPYDRINPKTRKVEHVNGYTREGRPGDGGKGIPVDKNFKPPTGTATKGQIRPAAAPGGPAQARKGPAAPKDTPDAPDAPVDRKVTKAAKQSHELPSSSAEEPVDHLAQAVKSEKTRSKAEARRQKKLAELRKGLGGQPTVLTDGWEMRESRDPEKPPQLGMSDQTYAEWLNHTLKSVRTALKDQGTTQQKYKKDDYYTDARTEQQQQVIDAILARAASVPKDHKAVMTGGRPGAGKSTSLEDQRITDAKYFTVDSDIVKAEMINQGLAPDIPGLTPFEASPLIHDESSDITEALLGRLTLQGTNVVVDGTMNNPDYVEADLDVLEGAGYDVSGVFVQVTPETATRRSLERHREGVEDMLARGQGWSGRFVDPNISAKRAEDGKDNEYNFEQLKFRFGKWVKYNNDVDGSKPKKLESSHDNVEFSQVDLRSVNSGVTLRDAEFYLQLV